jgi:hypothetical protein
VLACRGGRGQAGWFSKPSVSGESLAKTLAKRAFDNIQLQNPKSVFAIPALRALQSGHQTLVQMEWLIVLLYTYEGVLAMQLEQEIAQNATMTLRFIIHTNLIANGMSNELVEIFKVEHQASVDSANPAKRGRRKPGHRGGRSSGCVVARSLPSEQVAFSGDTTIAPAAEIVAL